MTNAGVKILVVDDEFSVRDSLREWFEQDGYTTHAAENATEALRMLQKTTYDVILLDIKMPGMDGIELQQRISQIDSSIAVIMLTAFASVDTAVKALKQGAFDYVTKPVDPDELSHLVQRALAQKKLKSENAQLKSTIDGISEIGEMVGESPAIRKVIELIDLVAQSDTTVLVTGESGTGKELIARAIHVKSRRRYFPVVPVNCGALPETLLESELFGHEKGAFTGASFRRKGKIEMADGGTLFLDEVGTLSQKTQVELLRVIETRELMRLGASKTIHVDFRIICATNENLTAAVEEGRFREDLFYRLNVFNIPAPPLRERRTDIGLLAKHFVARFSAQMDKRITEISDDAMAALEAHRWPGNVRELANAIERAMVVGTPPAIHRRDLPLIAVDMGDGAGADSLAVLEQRHIEKVLIDQDWNVTQSAKILEIDRATLYNKIKKYDLHR